MVFAVLTAGGIGTRMHQDVPKQFLTVNNKPIIVYTLEAFQANPSIDYIYVACLGGWEAILEAYARQYKITKLAKIVVGGKSGQESIFHALKAIHEDHGVREGDVVMIHDGNRPLVSQDIIDNNLAIQQRFGSAVAVIPTNEVVFVSSDGISSSAQLNREELWRTQTPHSYYFKDLWELHQRALADGVVSTPASCSLMQHYGFPTFFSKGSEKNIKITTLEDLEIFAALLMNSGTSVNK